MEEDGKAIIEKPGKIEDRKTHYHNLINSPIKRIIFPRMKYKNLGFIFYKFKGVFEVDKER